MAVPLEKRISLLTAEYGDLPADDLIESVQRIRKRLGGQNVQAAEKAIRDGNIRSAVEICLAYYDKSYGQGRKYLQDRSLVIEVPVADPHESEVTGQLLDAAAEAGVAAAARS